MAPVKVMTGGVPLRHTAVVPLIVAVGNGLTVTVAVPLCAWLHAVLLPSLTLTRVYTNDPADVVGTVTVAVLTPLALDTVWLPPPLTE